VAATKKDVTNRLPQQKLEPLAALPSWIRAAERFQSTTATGKHWTNNEGKEQGTMRGTVSGGLPHYFPKMGGVGETEI
jgi:hypothetical protein